MKINELIIAINNSGAHWNCELISIDPATGKAHEISIKLIPNIGKDQCGISLEIGDEIQPVIEPETNDKQPD
jgi:hypothetical protein